MSFVRALLNGTATNKPKLMIFDNNDNDLRHFRKQYEGLGYDVTAVLVMSKSNHPISATGERIIDLADKTLRAAAEEQCLKACGASRARARATGAFVIDHPTSMKGIDYLVANPADITMLLKKHSPDAVLSNKSMRNASGEIKDGYMGSESAGNTIMALAMRHCPKAARVIHVKPDETHLVPKAPTNGNVEVPLYLQPLAEAVKLARRGYAHTVLPIPRQPFDNGYLTEKISPPIPQAHRIFEAVIGMSVGGKDASVGRA